MPQKIDIHGLFIDPEMITDLQLQKRIAVYIPVFVEVASKSIFGRFSSAQRHVVRFDHQEPYGIILADVEQPDPASRVMNYQEAAIERFLKGVGRVGKNVFGHINELLKIEISGDREYRILQPGRIIKQTTIREIPAKVCLASGQWSDVFKSSPNYDFQGGNPYPVTDVGASALMITTKDKVYILFGAGVDASDTEVKMAYKSLVDVYNEIQTGRDQAKVGQEKRPLIQMPQINIELPKIELPKIEFPPIKFQSPFVFGKKEDKTEALPTSEQNLYSEENKNG